MPTTTAYSTRDLINALVDGKTVMAFNPERYITVHYSIIDGATVYEYSKEIATCKQIAHAIMFMECLMYGGCEWKVL